MTTDDKELADLEKQVGELEQQVKEVVAKRESDEMPDSREVVRPSKGKKPSLKLHDNKATHVMKAAGDDEDDDDDDDDDDDMMDKAKKKSSDDEDDDDDDMEKADVLKAKKKSSSEDDGDDVNVDDWSEAADAKKKGKMKKRADKAEDTLIFKGQTIVKSKVGAAQFGIFKAMADELQAGAEKIAKAENEALMATLRKRADDEFPHVPGSTDERALMLKAVGGMSEDMRKAFTKVFQVAEKLSKAGFDRLGVNSFQKSGTVDDMKKGADDFMKKVDEIARADKITRDVAMQKARKDHPELFKAYQGQN